MNIKNIEKGETTITARITAVHRNKFEFMCKHGSGFAVLKKGNYYKNKEIFPATGDFVLLNWRKNAESVITKTYERKSSFERLDPSSSGYKSQVIAANFDYVFIMQSLDNNFNLRRLERYLTLGWQSGAIPVVILTKTDKADDYNDKLIAAENLALGTEVIALSAKTGQGTEKINKYLKPEKVIVFLGSSGVGKSTLLNALAGKNIMQTNNVREKDGRGKHTTTSRQLISLDNGAMIIDTPGMRELGMWNAEDGLKNSFSDIEKYFGKCRFRNCTHQSEPGCAVKDAVKRGDISREHWESYLRLRLESEFNGNKDDYLRKKEKRFKDIAIFAKKYKSIDYKNEACTDSFKCKVCGALVFPENAGSKHRNHCPHCLASIHADNKPGDRASLCKGLMDPIGVWVREGGEWAIIHRCRSCGELSSNRIAADDNSEALMSIAKKPLLSPPFPLKDK